MHRPINALAFSYCIIKYECLQQGLGKVLSIFPNSHLAYPTTLSEDNQNLMVVTVDFLGELEPDIDDDKGTYIETPPWKNNNPSNILNPTPTLITTSQQPHIILLTLHHAWNQSSPKPTSFAFRAASTGGGVTVSVHSHQHHWITASLFASLDLRVRHHISPLSRPRLLLIPMITQYAKTSIATDPLWPQLPNGRKNI